MTILSKFDAVVGIFDNGVKKFLRDLLDVNTAAAAGSTQGGATLLTAGKNVITGADGTKGVRLPISKDGMTVEIVNSVSNQDLAVYPDSGGIINALSADAAFTVAAGTAATFYCISAGQWYVRAAGTLTGVATSASTAQLNVATLAASATRTVTTTATITSADHNAQVILNSATGFVTTLPAPIAGFQCEIINKTTPTSGSHTVVTNASANVIKGAQFSAAGDAGDTGTADDTITFVVNSSVPGDMIVLRSDGTSWFVRAFSTLAASITFTQAS